MTMVSRDDWSFPFEGPLHEVFPALHEAQNSWMSQIESLAAPDRRTHELIRLVCTVILGNPAGVERHARLAREVGASWDEILGSIPIRSAIVFACSAVEAIPHARRGFESARDPERDLEEENDDDDDR